MIRVNVRMMGTLRDATGRSEEELSLEEGADVSSAIRELIDEHGEELERALVDPVIQSALPNALILLNGVEIGNLKGLVTALRDGDKMVLLPVTH
ncbi:MAG: MoaD family protein, partial [Candidatus Bathyarchaeota archaeon]|nr:MoaD family protein [Candidatus Bathyarchaeota archaeon]